MRPAQLRYKLWHIMLAIATFAGLLAVFEVTVEVGILIAISAVVLPTVMASPGRRLHPAAWVVSLYPVVLLCSLYATWLTAWCVLGHRPRSVLDDPKFISLLVEVPYFSTQLLILGLPFALLLCISLVLDHVVQSAKREGVRPFKVAVRLLIPLSSWMSSIAVSRWSLFDSILGWYMD